MHAAMGLESGVPFWLVRKRNAIRTRARVGIFSRAPRRILNARAPAAQETTETHVAPVAMGMIKAPVAMLYADGVDSDR